MFFRHLRAQELDRPQVLQRLGIQLHRREALASVFEGDQRPILLRHRPKQARGGVAHRLHLLGGDLEAIEVRDPGVIAAAVQIPPVRREHEALGRGPRLLQHGDRLWIVRRQIVDAEDLHRLLAVHLAHRSRQQRPVRRDVQIEGDAAIGEGVDLVPALVGLRDPHQGHIAVQVPQAPDRLVLGIDHDVADAPVADQHLRAPRLDVHLHQVAVGVVVGGVEDLLGVRIIGQGRDAVEHGALDVDEVADRAGVQR